ncbi:UvrD-helicase domain-containing protein [Candidatus Peregrinibacteria bacterium]|jgi:DNA helicase II / ATP-dependent DNA helicase PcrA|nr:UvrD-helicase domain-containing protein [Candidatus Peregrinibacteria bacterium]
METHPILQGLNEPQTEAVQTTDGPVLILAGAGSGKTRVLTHRIAYLMSERKVSPHNVLAVTFTNKAANEMKRRILDLMYGEKQANMMWETAKGINLNRSDLPVVGTFHSVCVQILRRYLHLLGFENRFVIYDDTDSQVLMKLIMKERGISKDKLNHKAVLAHIAGAKNALLSPDEFARQAHSNFSEQVAVLYPIYQKRLAQNQALDFDDLIMKTVELFEKEPQILDELQERFKYISVDEYQDTNHAQYVFIKKLAEKYRNLCVVGDDWQSIYSWRGATMRNILDFEKDYKEAKVIKLEQNYRSTAVILDASDAIIRKNKSRTDKKLWTAQKGGEKIRIWEAMDERDEGSMITKEVQRLLLEHEKPDYRDFAVLYRTNAQSRVIEESMMRYGIPYRIVGGVKFYKRKEIKDVLSYMRLIENPADTVSLLRIINTPPRKIGSRTLEVLHDLSRARGDEPLYSIIRDLEAIAENRFPETKVKTLKRFFDLILKLQKVNKEYPASGVIKHFLEESGYKEFLLDGSSEGETRFENVQELISVASKYDKLEPGISLSTFLEEVALISDLDKIDDRDNALTLMTLHSAKGLEFRNVFICGMEEGVFPHSRSMFDPNELEEERRLMYVGLTRAMERAYLLYAERRLLYGDMKQNAPSQFLRDLPDELLETNYDDDSILSEAAQEVGGILGKYMTRKGDKRYGGMKRVPVEKATGFYADQEPIYDGVDELPDDGLSGPGDTIEYSPGDRVHHHTFGEGVVASVQGGVITVAFKDAKHGVKKLAASVAPLKKI